MRILFLTNHLNGKDGWSNYSLDIIKGVKNCGNEVLCLTSVKSKQVEIKEEVILKSFVKYSANPIVSFSTSLKISKIIKEFSPDVIHFLVEPYATTLPFFDVHNAKTFITIHGTYSVMPNLLKSTLKKKISEILTVKTYKKVNRIISVSEYTKNYLSDYLPEVREKIKVITNGVDLEKYKMINRFDDSENKIKQILFVGAIKKRKGILEAIEVLKYYKNNFSKNFIYNIVGSYDTKDVYYQSIVKKIKEYDLNNEVKLKGVVNGYDLENYYNNADLFLMLPINDIYNFEGFGLVYLEANAKGAPTIGSTGCGANEAILNGTTGFVVDPKDYRNAAEKINLILNKNSVSRQDCCIWAEENNIKTKIDELVKYYKK